MEEGRQAGGREKKLAIAFVETLMSFATGERGGKNGNFKERGEL